MTNGFSDGGSGGGAPPGGSGFGAPPSGYGTPPSSVPFGQSGAFGPTPGGQPQGSFGQPQSSFGQPQGSPPTGAPQGFGAPQGSPPTGAPQGFGAPPGFGASPGFGAPPGFGAAPPPGVSHGFGAPPTFNPGGFGASGPTFTAPTGGLGFGRLVASGCITALVALGGVTFSVYRIWSSGSGSAGFPAMRPPGTAASAPVDPDDALGAKLDKYIEDCVNIFSPRAIDSRSRYLSWADAESGPTGQERVVYGVYTFPIEPSRCTAAITAAAAMPPQDARLEAAATAYGQALDALAPILVEADTYYSRQNYRDDAMAQGRTLHPRLMTAFDGFMKANSDFRGVIDELGNERETRLLARIANVPAQRPWFLILTSLRSAKRLVRIVDESQVDERGTITGLEPTTLASAVAEVERDVDALRAFASTNAQAMSPYSMYSSYERECNEFVIAAKELSRRVQANRRFDDSEMHIIAEMNMGETVSGSPMQVADGYDELVSAFNNLN